MTKPVAKLSHDVGMVLFWCEPCDKVHAVAIDPNTSSTVWEFNNDLVQPTIQPSLLIEPYPGWQVQCHSFIRNGVWEYLSDCEHDKAGQKVPMIPVVDWPL